MTFSNFKKYVSEGYHLPQLLGNLTDKQMEVFDYAEELHGLFCEGVHEGANLTCEWEYEEDNEDYIPWVLPAHNKWFEISKIFIEKNIDPDMAWDAFNQVYFQGKLP